MENITAHFLFNLSLLIILFFLFFFIYRKPENLFKKRKTLFFYFFLSILICFIFSHHIDEGIILNLRAVPLIVGGLYFGLSPFLGFVIIALRGFLGLDTGFFISTITYTLLSFTLWYFSSKFSLQKPTYRVVCASIVALAFSFTELFLMMQFSVLAHSFDLIFAYMVISPLSVAVLSYFLEVSQKNYQYFQEIANSEKAASIEQMGAAITHEIRNPLTTAIGFVELLDQQGLPKEKRTQYISILREELDSAERIIQGYLAYSKPIAESTVHLQVNEELNNIIQLLKPLANYHSVKIISNFSATKLIGGDRSKFQQSFLYIIKYMIESTKDGGILVIETAEIEGEIVILLQHLHTESKLNIQDFTLTIAFGMIHSMKGSVHVRDNQARKFALYISFKPVKCHLLKK